MRSLPVRSSYYSIRLKLFIVVVVLRILFQYTFCGCSFVQSFVRSDTIGFYFLKQSLRGEDPYLNILARNKDYKRFAER
jgi:hypothetical protein